MELILHSAPGSNSSQRVEWALRYKGILYKTHEDASASIGTFGYVTSLSVNGTMISESMAILEFLQEIFPSPSLLPTDPLERAFVREVCEYVNSTVHPAQNRTILKFLRPELSDTDKKKLRAMWVSNCLQSLKGRLFRHSEFAVGKSFSMADIFVATIYKKALSHGAERDKTYESHWATLSNIEGKDVVKHNNSLQRDQSMLSCLLLAQKPRHPALAPEQGRYESC